MEERELVNKLKAGSQEAFRDTVGLYQRMVLNCAYKFVRDRAAAEDITQEVFLEVFQSINRFRGDSKLSTWVYRITISRSLNYMKYMKRKKRFAMVSSIFAGSKLVMNIPMPEQTLPDKAAEEEERKKTLHDSLQKLPENQRVALMLNKYDELSYEEIADIMKTTVSAVESLLFRAKANLRGLLKNYYKKHL